jgi:hypothetical protein
VAAVTAISAIAVASIGLLGKDDPAKQSIVGSADAAGNKAVRAEPVAATIEAFSTPYRQTALA